MQKCPSEKAKPQPELLDTRVRPVEWAEALELQLRRWGLAPPAREPRTLPNAQGTRHSPSRARRPRPRPGRRPRTSAPGSQDLPHALAAPAGRLAAHCAPPSRPAFRAPPLAAQRSASSSRGCIADAAAAGRAGAAPGAEPGYAGDPWARVSSADSTAPRGRESVGPRRGVGQARPERPPPRGPRGKPLGALARGSGRGRRAPDRHCPRADRGRPPSGPPRIWAGSGPRRREGRGRPGPRVRAPGAAGPRSARALRARPPPSSAAPRGSGAVPAQSPRRAAPRPTPASARLRVTSRPPIGPCGQEGGAEAGELTAAPGHWSARRTRAVAGRQRYPEPESFQLRRVELSGSGPG